MKIEQTGAFKRAYKRLYAKQKTLVDKAIREIAADPNIGEEKKQDLAGVYVHKFKVFSNVFLLAYRFDPATLTLLLVGVHENFYRELKR